MPSVFAWVDFAEEDRRKMAQVIDSLRETDTRDELGLGVIRDAIADLLFPGTSTIQTRARYFLFIPWIYRRHERNGTSGADLPRKARRDEDRLIGALAEGNEQEGVIGIEKRVALQRTASSIYWSGLATWRIRRFQGSQEQYHRAWQSVLRRRPEMKADDDMGSSVDGLAEIWDPELPQPAPDFLRCISFKLTRSEAEYLQQRILGLGSTLLGYLVSKTKPTVDAKFAWNHPEADSFPKALTQQLEHARLFSEAMHGAAILYNLMLSEARHNAEWIETYRERFASWGALMRARSGVFANWKRAEFWALIEEIGARVTSRTRLFVNNWLNIALGTNAPEAIADHDPVRQLIRNREYDLKKAHRARLCNPEALNRWNGAAGAEALNYRWHRVQVIVADIARAFEP